MPRPRTGFATFSLDALALGLLMRGPKHGYQLYQEYQDAFQLIWKVGRSKFYAALAALHKGGDLTAHLEPQDDRPPRKVYAITPAGRRRFLAWLETPVTPARAVRVEFIAKLRFYALLDLPGVDDLINAQMAVCRTTLEQWQERKDEHRLHHGDHPFAEVVFDFRRRQAEFIIEWLDACRHHLSTAERS